VLIKSHSQRYHFKHTYNSHRLTKNCTEFLLVGVGRVVCFLKSETFFIKFSIRVTGKIIWGCNTPSCGCTTLWINKWKSHCEVCMALFGLNTCLSTLILAVNKHMISLVFASKTFIYSVILFNPYFFKRSLYSGCAKFY